MTCLTVFFRLAGYLALAFAAPGTVLAAAHALLIGVSAYPAFDEEDQLLAPKNDVVLVRQMLVERGFAASNVRVLADDVPGAQLPTRRAILDALATLAKTVK